LRFKNRRTIRRTLIIYFAIFALIPLSTVVFVALNAVNQSAYEQAADQRNLAAEVRIADIERLLTNAESAIELILVEPAQAQRVLSLVGNGGLPSSSRPITIRNVERALRQQLDSQEVFSRLFIYNIAGEIVVSTDAEDNEGIVRNETFFAAARSPETLIHASRYHSEHSRPELFITTAVIDARGAVVGHVAGELNFEALNTLLSSPLGSSQTSETYLVDVNRVLLSPTSENLSVGTRLDSEGITAALRRESSISTYINYRGIRVIGVYRWLPELQIALLAEIEESEALEVSSQIQSLSLAVSLLALGGVLIVGSLGAQQFTRPIAVLTETAAAVIAGDLSQRAHIRSNNEIGQLANAFNQMTGRLNDLINTLEQRIAERTKELEIARQQAENASQAKSVFLSNMSHELRTPLNMVIGYTSSMLNMPQMYAGNELPQIFRDDVRLIQQNGQHLLGLINDILDLSKIEAGKFALHYTETDMNDVFKGVMATAIGLVNNKPIQLRSDFPNDLPKVWGDQTRIRQILLNLLSNAIKFTNAGVVTLHAHLDKERLYIAVKDTGVGIPKDAIATIFDRFEQGQADSSIQGTGLGLDISQRLAQMHDSSISIESEVGKGSTFSFALSLIKPEFMNLPQTPYSIEPSIVTMEHDGIIQHHIVLLAETDATMRQNIHEALEGDAYVIVDVQEDDDVAEYAANLAPDLIVMSGNFANEAAFELMECLNLQEESKNIPILVLTEQNLAYPSYIQRVSPDFSKGALQDRLEAVLKSHMKE
jgi:signal transduction histidine kinase/CheY-like chemotaxis protein